MSYTDKVKLDAIATGANNYSHPAGDGNLHVPANGTANNGKFLQATATAGIYAWASLPVTSLSTLGVTATAADLNKLDGVTATATHLNYINTLSSDAQTQLNGKAATDQTMYIGTTEVAINRALAALTLGVSISGDAATASSISAATVGAATAGLVAYSIGSYAMLSRNSTNINNVNVVANTVYDGSAFGVSGTWRAMGNGVTTSKRVEDPEYGITTRFDVTALFIRIS